MPERRAPGLGDLPASCALCSGWRSRHLPPPRSRTGQDFTQIERGRYLTYAADCAACHDDPYQHRPFAGGGRSRRPSASLWRPTSRRIARPGIGSLSDAQFDAALRHGRRPDGKRLYPAMPFVTTPKCRTTMCSPSAPTSTPFKPVHHAVVARPTALSVQYPHASMCGLGRLVLHARRIQARSIEVARLESRRVSGRRGRGIAPPATRRRACSAATRRATDLQGYSIQGWFAPNLTSDEHPGLGRLVGTRISSTT